MYALLMYRSAKLNSHCATRPKLAAALHGAAAMICLPLRELENLRETS
jgi:hypothetical protein